MTLKVTYVVVTVIYCHVL